MSKITKIYASLAKSGLCVPLMSASMLTVAISTNAFANAENTTKKSTNTSDTLVVIADNNGQDAPEDRKVSRNEIRVKQAQSVGEILKNVPGVQAGHPSALGQRFKIRGMDDQFINVTIDGARQEGYHFHHAGNYGIDPEMLKQVDIKVGSNSITHDIGALGGALKFETVDAGDLLEPGQLFGAKGKLNYSSNGSEFQQSLATYGRLGAADLLGYFTHRNMHDSKSGRDNSGRDPIPTDGRLLNYLLKAKFNLTDEQYINVSKEHYKNDAVTNHRLNFGNDVSPKVNNGNKAKYAIDRDTHSIIYGYAPVDNDLIDLKLTAYHTEQTSTHMKSVSGNGKGFDSFVKTQGIKVRNISSFDTQKLAHALTYGYEYFDTRMGYTDVKENAYKKETERGNASAVYLEDDIQLADFHIIPGVRWDHYKYHTINNHESFDRTYAHFSKALGLKYEFGASTTLFANYTELFRGPLGKELGRGISNHSNNLKATTGYNLETGVAGTYPGIFTDNDSLVVLGKVFQTNFKNLSTTLAKNELHNIPKARLQGFELATSYKLDNLSLKATYAKVNNKIIEGNGLFDKAFTRGLEFGPSVGDSITVGGSYLFDTTDIEFGWNTRFVLSKNSKGKDTNDKKEAIIVDVHKQGYGVSNMYVSWAPKTGAFKNTELLFGIDNMFDKRYREHSYYLGTTPGQEEKGRTYKATISYKF
ncbi:TonB-dependent receptor domain-containing protein [Xenorhabdus griffiniae]|uniref:TonB-dependent receptor n=1 Tax=Xenorhabdus griffiniae TaxID=351672 RepID=A0ABY9XIT3_9GAMM|nr:TonB-dependent receptor [Xenorhabdus griffiniae]MBD1227685.1 TonB-dependent receptor [Xenorhabdus griffiniae]MBE8588357.1 TonB-dependent receptor [Xenorhabdus griffiniae]WMV72839.1 TonB-dependent receptor [Xenorhabdus griffiniae]WNH02518.1 TonB-dependent receptor [Xenorhabdus griffiniae]